MSINIYYSSFLSFIICYSIAIPIDTEGKSTLTNHHGQRSIQNDQIISRLLIRATNGQKSRVKRDNTDSLDIKAIQATINDHRTMIEDNRIMINNIVNNSITNIGIQQAVSNHYSNTLPAWNSWRDIALIILIFVLIVQIVYFCTCQVKLRPWDYLVSAVFARHDTRQSQKRKNPPTLPQSFVKTVEDHYADIHHNSTTTR